MPPNKPKLFTASGKPTVRSIVNNVPDTSLDSEQAQKFEVELCWCIQQLQRALNSEKLNNKQIQDYKKSLNTLMNNNAAMVKKRQIMRSSFGDYRKKMADEERKITKNALYIKLKPAAPSEKSVFVKRRGVPSTSDNFKFNFKTPEECDSGTMKEMVSAGLQKSTGSFSHSDNCFRFNFGLESS